MRAFLRWQAEWGDQLPMLLEMQEAGVPVKALQERPHLPEWLLPIYFEFLSLSKTRTVTQAGIARSISPSEYLAYCHLGGMSATDIRWLWQYIEMFDDEWISIHLEKVEKDRQRPSSKGGLPQ